MRVSTDATISLGKIDFYCRIVADMIPGEPAEQDYPGCDACVNYVESVEVLECEYHSDRDDTGWGYASREGLGDCVAIADRWCRDYCDDNHDFVVYAVSRDCSYFEDCDDE